MKTGKGKRDASTRPGSGRVDAVSIAERVAENAPAYFPGVGAPAKVVGCRRVRRWAAAPLYLCRVETPAGDAEVRVRIVPAGEVGNAGLTEFEYLKRLYDHLGERGPLRVVRPLDFFADLNAVVTGGAGGVNFLTVLLRDTGWFVEGRRREALHLAADRCGRWLARYHGLAGRGSRPVFGEDFRADLMRRIGILRVSGLPGPLERRAEQTVRALEAFGRRFEAPVAVLHGEYEPRKIRAGDGWVCVAELGGCRPGFVYEDLASFLLALETLNPYPRQPFFRRRNALALRMPFLQGYFGVGPVGREDRIALEGFLLAALVRRAASSGHGRRPAFLKFAFDKAGGGRYYRRRIEAQCDRILQLLAG